jgi:hypothetical protein
MNTAILNLACYRNHNTATARQHKHGFSASRARQGRGGDGSSPPATLTARPARAMIAPLRGLDHTPSQGTPGKTQCLPMLLVKLDESVLVNSMMCSLVSSRPQRRPVASVFAYLTSDFWPPPSGSWTYVANLLGQKETKSVILKDTWLKLGWRGRKIIKSSARVAGRKPNGKFRNALSPLPIPGVVRDLYCRVGMVCLRYALDY